jgi:hypothetical protein
MNCGHETPFWIKAEGSVIPLPPSGPVVGLFPGANFSVKEISMEKTTCSWPLPPASRMLSMWMMSLSVKSACSN